MKKNRYQCSGENHTTAKLKEVDIIAIRQLYAAGEYTYKQLAQRFSVDATCIAAIIKRKTWKEIV